MQQRQNDDTQCLPSGLTLGWAGPEDTLDDTQTWLRLSATEMTLVRVLSPAPLFYPGHWVPNIRAYRLCTYPACQFCAAGRSGGVGGRNLASERRVRHLVAIQATSGDQRIWEFSAAVARQLQAITGYRRDGADETRTVELRGLALAICREGGRPAGNVLVSTAPTGIAWPEYLPEPLDVAAHLATSWKRAALHDGKAQPRLPIGF